MKETSKSLANFLGQALPFITILAVVTPFIILESLFFPYITGKAFYFRILVEVMALLYVFYAMVDRSVRPKWGVMTALVTTFIAILGLSTIASTDPLRSFWSNYERMEGYVLFLHLAAYFFIAGAVMKYKEGWWKWFFRASLGMSIIVGADAFTDLYGKGAQANAGYRIFGNLGNSSYLGIYALASFFIALFFIIRRINRRATRPEEGAWVSITVYSLIALFNLIVLFNTGTRGSFVGLVGGIFVAAILIALFERKHKIVRITGISLIGLSILFVAALGAAKHTSFVKNSDMLTRFSELITFDVKGVIENQGKARGLLWGMAWHGVKDRPVLGWGLDNFHYIFAKYYDPQMSGQEQWFDRSHNVFMDWLTQTGFLGLLSYLSLVGGGLYVIWRKREEEGSEGSLSVSEKAIITGGLIAYLGHNLFVFDNLTSYMLFFSLLAFFYQYEVRNKIDKAEERKDRYAEFSSIQMSTASLVAIVSFVFIVYTTNIKPMLANLDLIAAIQQQVLDAKTGQAVTMPIKERFERLQQSIAYGSMTNSEQREQLLERGLEVFGSAESVDFKSKVHQYVIEQFNIAINRTPNDPRPYFFYSMYMARIGDLVNAQKLAEKLVSLSPTKLSFINIQASIEAQLKNDAKFLELAKRSHELDVRNVEAKNLYISALAQNKKFDEIEKVTGGDIVPLLSDWNVVSLYIDAGQTNRMIGLLQKAIAQNPNVLDLRSSLANLYVRINKPALAIKELEQIKTLAPQYTESINKFIQQISSKPTKK